MNRELLKKIEHFKSILIFLLMLAFVLVYWQLDGRERVQLFALDNSQMGTKEFLEVFIVTSKEACTEKDHNKYGLPEDECLTKIRLNSARCRDKTIEKFSGKVNKIEKMLLIGNFFTSCVFNKEQDKD